MYRKTAGYTVAVIVALVVMLNGCSAHTDSSRPDTSQRTTQSVKKATLRLYTVEGKQIGSSSSYVGVFAVSHVSGTDSSREVKISTPGLEGFVGLTFVFAQDGLKLLDNNRNADQYATRRAGKSIVLRTEIGTIIGTVYGSKVEKITPRATDLRDETLLRIDGKYLLLNHVEYAVHDTKTS